MSAVGRQHDASALIENAASHPVPLTDSGLRCPACGYNLTGLETYRCPECGEAYDPEQLRRELCRRHLVSGWDDERRSWPIAFAYTCFLTWFRPAHFARAFPIEYRPEGAERFKLIATALAGGFLAIPVALGAWSLVRGVVLWLSLVCIMLLSAILGEKFVWHLSESGMCRWEPRQGSRGDRGAFLGILAYYRSYLLLIMLLLGGAGLLQRAGKPGPDDSTIIAAGLLWLISSLTVSLACLCRRAPGQARRLVLYFLACAAGIWGLALLMQGLYWLCRAAIGVATHLWYQSHWSGGPQI